MFKNKPGQPGRESRFPEGRGSFSAMVEASAGPPSAGPWLTHTLCLDSHQRSWGEGYREEMGDGGFGGPSVGFEPGNVLEQLRTGTCVRPFVSLPLLIKP